MRGYFFRKCLCFFVAPVAFVFAYCAEAREVRVVVDFQYTEARDFSEGLAAVRSNDLWGYIDHTGRVAIPFTWKVPEVGAFSAGVAFTGSAFIDMQGNPLFDGKIFDEALPFSEGLAAVQTDGQWGFIDLTGRFAISPIYEGAGRFSKGMAPVKKDGLWGYIDNQGRMLIAPRFLRAAPFSGSLAAVEMEGRVGYVDRSGRFAIVPKYDEGGSFGDGLAPVRGPSSRNDWGYVDVRGREVIPRQFNRAGMYSNGFAPVATDARCGYIDVRGVLVIEALYDDARPFSEGLAAVERDGRWGYIRVK